MTEGRQRTEPVPYGERREGEREVVSSASAPLTGGRVGSKHHPERHPRRTDSSTGPAANGLAGRGKQLGGKEEK